MAKKITNIAYYQDWQKFVKNQLQATPVDITESVIAKQKRITLLEQNYEAWFAYYFPKYYSAEPADFHIKASKRVLQNPEYYEVRAWSRGLAKSARTMMEVLYLTLTGKKKNILLASSTQDSADRLLLPYKKELENNSRIINDYGTQVAFGSWEKNEFITTKGVSFRAIGAGQSPLGTRNESVRPDVILCDDMDTSEDLRNTEITKNKIKWIQQDLIGTRNPSSSLLVIVCGNIRAKYCIITELASFANHFEIINIRDKEGKSSWAQALSEEQIDIVLSKISYESAQKEYFNNPMDGGDVFKNLQYAKIPTLKSCDAVVVYADPATSNKAHTKSSEKAIVIVAKKQLDYFIHTAFVDSMGNSQFIDYLFECYRILQKEQVYPIYIFVENNSLQDPFYEQVLMPLIYQKSKEQNIMLPIRADQRKKPDKYTRIEGTLGHINNLGHLFFNEKTTPHIERLTAQFEAVHPKSKNMDGPDAVEGAVFLLQQRITTLSPGSISVYNNVHHKNRF